MGDRLTAGLAVQTVQGAGFGFVSVGFRILAQDTVSHATAVVGHSMEQAIVRVKLDGLIEVFYRLMVRVRPVVTKAPADVGQDIVRVKLDGLIEVLYRLLVLVQIVVSPTPGPIGVCITRVQPNLSREFHYSQSVLPVVVITLTLLEILRSTALG